MFIALTPCYQVHSADGTSWVRKGTFYVNTQYIVMITFSAETVRAAVTLHDGTVYTVPLEQIAALVGVNAS